MGRGRQVADAVVQRQCRGASTGHTYSHYLPSMGDQAAGAMRDVLG
jgi:hypothetical protein